MRVEWIDLKQDPVGRAMISMVVNVPPSELTGTVLSIKNGKPYTVDIRPYRESKSKDQLGAIWGKIGELANALYASKDEIYEECLRRYGPSVAMRIPKEAVPTIETMFRITDVKAERSDGTVFVRAYKGLSEMDTAEASAMLDGVLSECKSVGISAEVKNG